MKKLMLISLLFCISTIPIASQTVSEWMFHIRGTDEYMYANKHTLKTGKDPYDDNFLWVIEAMNNEAVRIRNKQTGEYLQLGDNGHVRLMPMSDSQDQSFIWSYAGFTHDHMTNCGWFTLSNSEGDKDSYLVAQNGGIYYLPVDRNTEFKAHWTPVRKNSAGLPFVLSPNEVTESSFLGERKAIALSEGEIVSNYHGTNHWKLSRDISAFPRFTAKGNMLVPALYNMALEEMLQDVRTDSTYMAGALWPDTWTRDAVYSIYFSYSWIMPEVSRRTLEKQTLKNPSEALQDTGSGGSYPISTDRVVWAIAAWEYYLVTGDKIWLQEAYEGLRNTALKDLHVAFDSNVNLFKGETCSMDWRTHTYPNWFTNVNIGESFSCGTNALHFFLYRFLTNAGSILKVPAEERELWSGVSEKLKKGMNEHFWNEEKGLFECYLYPEILGYVSSQRVGCMSNGLAAILGVASSEQVGKVVQNSPMYAYGAAVLYPSIPDDFAYHNKSIWPVWQTPLMYAAKSSGNSVVTEHLMKSLIRQSALFLTHKENLTYDTGYDRNTALNSDRQLWSVASYISMVYRVLFGMELTMEGIHFNPVLPAWVGTEIKLEHFKYRDAVLNITVKGEGTKIASLIVNGKKKTTSYILPAGAKGIYDIVIAVTKENESNEKINRVPAGPHNCWSPIEPVIRLENKYIHWTMQPGVTYRLKGMGVDKEVQSPYNLQKEKPGYYSVCAVDEQGIESDLSNPVLYTSYERRYEAEDFTETVFIKTDEKGYSGNGYVKDYSVDPANLSIAIDIPETGDYVIRFTGANGHGPHNTFCTIRSLFLDEKDCGTIILEAYGDWEEWTQSNHIVLRSLSAGKHTLSLKINPEGKGFDNNMSFNKENLNDWLIDYLTVVRL